jgi:hypothetical protein
MSSPLSLNKLRDHVTALGPSKAHLIKTVDSIGQYTRIFVYHMSTARDAMKGVLNQDDPHVMRNLEIIWGTHEQRTAFRTAEIVCEANLLGCVHSARALFDVFSHLVNELLVSPAISKDQCNIHNVTKALPSSPLKHGLEVLLKSAGFDYVSALVNTSKHHFIVDQSTHIDFESEFVGIRVSAFEYKSL